MTRHATYLYYTYLLVILLVLFLYSSEFTHKTLHEVCDTDRPRLDEEVGGPLVMGTKGQVRPQLQLN